MNKLKIPSLEWEYITEDPACKYHFAKRGFLSVYIQLMHGTYHTDICIEGNRVFGQYRAKSLREAKALANKIVKEKIMELLGL